MNNFQWYSKLARFAEEHPGLGDIKYGQMNLIAEFVAKEEAAQQLRAADICHESVLGNHVWKTTELGEVCTACGKCR